MEFMNRSNPSSAPQQAGNQQPNVGGHPTPPKKKRFSRKDGDKGMRITSVVLLFSVTILLVALAASFVFGPKSEKSYIENERLQAVFLNGGQVYFGNITDLNDKYLRMENIFYLRVNQVVQPNQEGTQQQASQNDISLVKLGCELHRPTNEMLINRSQVVFWENLKDEAGENTVPGAVKKYRSDFPNGQECQTANATGAGATTPTTGNTGGAAGTSEAGTDAGSDTDTGTGTGLTN